MSIDRSRHADDIKENVDVEIILVDAIRAESDNMFLKNARAAIAHHGAANVKLVATKIDVSATIY